MTLVIVESPTKAKTLSRFLGGEYTVVATYGHVSDLPQKKLGVKIAIKKQGDKVTEYSFKPEYVMLPKQSDRVEEIKKLSQAADKIVLATDPDREGEAIAWHVGQYLESKKIERAVFHEITQKAIQAALDHPREIDDKLVDAQQARRVMDRLVGYKLSPLLWRKVRRGSSAGRVQSVAVRLIVEREREIEAFKSIEYWRIIVVLENIKKAQFKVQLAKLDSADLEVSNGDQARQAEVDLRQAEYAVSGIEKKELRKTPGAPFTTSTLQQTAANRLGWSAKRTMQVAQILYEGGYITYHRTDSTNIAQEALVGIKQMISANFGPEYALESPRMYKTKSKVAQEAHEAIRPTDVSSLHTELGSQLNRDQVRLYELVWKRFVASQMAEAVGVTVKVTVDGKRGEKTYGLEAKGEVIEFEGWLKLYEKKNMGDETENVVETNQQLPEVAEGEKLGFVDVKPEQKYTQPPARYNDASLIKALEERGIGRPSTYAPTLSTIQVRQYTEKIERRFAPTALGIAVNDFLVANFPKIVDYDFTAQMENELDEIANGDEKWQPVLSAFWGPFEKTLETANDTAARVKVEAELTGDKCPKCTSTGSAQVGDVVIRTGKFGKFLACNRFPDCDWKESYVEKAGVACPKCTSTGSVLAGEVVIKKTKSRKSFFGCSNYPQCDFASWTRPTPKASEGAAKLNGVK